MRTSTVLALVCVLAGCHQQPPLKPRPAVQVEVVTSGISAGGKVVYSAVAEPKTTTTLAFRGPGYVERIMTVPSTTGGSRELGEGDRVRRGDVVANLREAEYRDQVDQAIGEVASVRAAVQKARLEFERTTRLFTTQSVTQPEMETATALRDATEAKLATAQAALEEARVALRDTALLAPVDGDVLKKSVELGAFMGPGTPVFVVGDVSSIKVVIGLPDVALRLVSPGQTVTVTTEALPGRTFMARISRIAAAANLVTRNFDVEVEILNRDRLWRPGMIASVELSSVSPQAALPLLLPLTAFIWAPGDQFAVMVVEGDGSETRSKLRQVELGDVAGNRVAVLRGLNPGERVITTGASMVTDGEIIEVLPTEVP